MFSAYSFGSLSERFGGIAISYSAGITAIVVAAACIAWAVGARRVAHRYAIWLAALLGTFVVPCWIGFAVFGGSLAPDTWRMSWRKMVNHKAAATSSSTPATERHVEGRPGEQEGAHEVVAVARQPALGVSQRVTTFGDLGQSVGIGEKPYGTQQASQSNGQLVGKARFTELPWSVVSFWVWLAGLSWGMLGLGVGLTRTWQLARRSAPCTDPRVAEIAAEVSARWQLQSQAEIRISDEVPTPLAIGILSPKILLPRDLAGGSAATLRCALAHELTHHCKHHLAISLLTRLLTVVNWFNPLSHWFRSRMLTIIEEVTDHCVCLHESRRQYAHLLLDLASGEKRPLPVAGALGIFGGRWTLERRLSALLDERRGQTLHVPMTLGVAFAASFMGIALAVVGVTAEIRRPDSDKTFASQSPAQSPVPSANGVEDVANIELLADQLPANTIAFVEFRNVPEEVDVSRVNPRANPARLTRSAWIKQQTARHLGISLQDLSQTLQREFEFFVNKSQGRICAARIKNMSGGNRDPYRYAENLCILANLADPTSETALRAEIQQATHVATAQSKLRLQVTGNVVSAWCVLPQVFLPPTSSLLDPLGQLHGGGLSHESGLSRLSPYRAMRGFFGPHLASDFPQVIWLRDFQVETNQSSLRWWPSPITFRDRLRFALLYDRSSVVEAVGGVEEVLATGDHLLRHHSFILAPVAPLRSAGDYDGIASLLRFPNAEFRSPQEWIPDYSTQYARWNWEPRRVSEAIDELVGHTGFVQSLVESVRRDPNGPQIDIKPLWEQIGTDFSAWTVVDEQGEVQSIYAVDVHQEEFWIDALRRLTAKAGSDVMVVEGIPYAEFSSELPGIASRWTLCVRDDHLLFAPVGRDELKRLITSRSGAGHLRDNLLMKQLQDDLAALAPGAHSMFFFSAQGSRLLPPFRLKPDHDVRIRDSTSVVRQSNTIFDGAWGAERRASAEIEGLAQHPSALAVTSTTSGWLLTGVVRRAANQQEKP